MAATAFAIETRKLSKRYEETLAVDRLDLRIQRGEVFGLLGPNGAGKTTTILMLLGLTEPTDGVALVDGLVPQQEALAVKRRIGYLPDDVGFYDDMTGRQNLRYTARLNRLPAELAEERVATNLDEVGLTDVADRKVKGYSRGMRQRLGLADALVKDPSILILDEPSPEEDADPVAHLLDLVQQVRRQQDGDRALVAEPPDQGQDLPHALRVDVHGRLVEDEDRRVLHERVGQAQALAHAARVALDLAVGHVGQADLVEVGGDALVKDPSILILDEPTVNIDPEGVREILALVRRLSDERSVTVLLSSHLLHQVEQVCDRIGIFLRGRLVALGTMEKLAAALEDRWAVEVGVAGGMTPDLVAVLERVPGVNGVERDGELAVLAADHDVRPAVVDALLDAGHPPVHLRRRGADLDAIYHRYFTGVDGDSA